MDYKESINLPKTDFPMKASLTVKEPQILAEWEKMHLYEKIISVNADKQKFILHDGPPYANGHIHIGTALNKILKDLINKSKTMDGYRSHFVPGWDCHGLPIELQVEKQLGKNKAGISKLQIRKLCREYATKFIDIQREEFKRLGVLGEWQQPYLTISPSYVATIVREFAKIAERGNLYKRKKPILWCSSCHTALAEAEVEYQDRKSPSIFVKFPLISDIGKQFPSLKGEKISIIIWTTTPWTIPANLAVCLHPELDYVAVKVGDEVFILAEGLLNQTMLTFGIEEFEILEKIPGHVLEGIRCSHPFYERESLIILGTHVTLEAGTGCVHTAPGHGQEDYEVGLKYNLEIYAPVDDAGKFDPELEFFGGQFVFDANKAVNEKLREHGALLKEEEIVHTYPHCWRCKHPVVFRATEQWFVSMEANALRNKALENIQKVTWIPPWGKERIYGMIEHRPDWCISRQRVWGVPIVAFYCKQCGVTLLDSNIIHQVANIFEKEGCDIWFSWESQKFLPSDVSCDQCGAKDFRKETDILDVWFDSGVSHAAVLEQREELGSPCDMYLEGSDQHRGWFHSSLLTCVGTRGLAPYRSVLTHGFVVDGKGEKMAKSKGNVIRPEEVIKKYGAELLRMWVASENYREDIRISSDILQRLSEAYRKIRNTCRFLLGNLSDFDPAKHTINYNELEELDQWALYKLNLLTEHVLKAYRFYEFHTVYHSITNFCINDMSAFYLDILKDRLYCSAASSQARRSAQTVLFKILDSLIRLLASILSFTADEIWKLLPAQRDRYASVHLAPFPSFDEAILDSEVVKKWELLLKIREQVLKNLEDLRARKEIGNSLEAAVTLLIPKKLYDFLKANESNLADLFIVSQVELKLKDGGGDFSLENLIEDASIIISKARGTKCQRCWKYSPSINKENNLVCGRCAKVLIELSDGAV
jgi:isoleucyl-tRNA synthetase